MDRKQNTLSLFFLMVLLLSTHHNRKRLTSLLFNSVDGSLVSLDVIELVDVGIQLRIILCVDHFQSLLTSLQRERHQNVGGSKILATEETTTIGCAGELRLQEVEVSLEVGVKEHVVEFANDAACDGTDEEGNLVAFEDCWGIVSFCSS